MKILEPFFIEVIEKLLQCNVEFILIGGYAVNYYGYGRYTGDIDFWINTTDENKSKFFDALNLICNSSSEINDLKKLTSINRNLFP